MRCSRVVALLASALADLDDPDTGPTTRHDGFAGIPQNDHSVRVWFSRKSIPPGRFGSEEKANRPGINPTLQPFSMPANTIARTWSERADTPASGNAAMAINASGELFTSHGREVCPTGSPL